MLTPFGQVTEHLLSQHAYLYYTCTYAFTFCLAGYEGAGVRDGPPGTPSQVRPPHSWT